MSQYAEAYEAVGQVKTDNQFIVQHAELVKQIAYHLSNRLPASVQVADLIQSGMIGLIEAAKNYRPDKGSNFKTFASIRIRGAMLDELRHSNWVPRSVYQQSRELSQAIHALENKYQREATAEEIANHLEITLEEYQRRLQDTKFCDLLSMDELQIDPENNEENGPLNETSQAHIRKLLAQKISELKEREQLLLSLYHQEELNFKEIGKVLEITESRVCQIYNQTVCRLRARMNLHT